MGFFKKLKLGYDYVKCNTRVSKAIIKEELFYSEQYENVVDFITKFEFLRHTWTESLHLKTEKQKLAMFCLVYYILAKYYSADPYFWAEDKNEMTDSEEEHWDRVSDLFDYPIDAYKDYILNNSDIINISDINEMFEKYKGHLVSINFANMLLSEKLNHLVHKYLLVYFNSDLFFEIDLMKDVIPIDERWGEINVKELENQIEHVIINTPDLGLNIEEVQYKLMQYRIFCDTTLLTTFDNNSEFSLKKNFK
jgi:hypothetical protein